MAYESTYIKPGFWITTRKPYGKGFLNLTQMITSAIPELETLDVLSYPVENSYPTANDMTSDQVSQTVKFFQYVIDTDTYYEYLGTTNGVITDYRELTPDEVTIINAKVKTPVDKIYADATALYADQKKQIKGFIYRTSDDDAHFEYLGTRNGDATDYKPVGGSSGGTTPAGNNTEIQFNNGGSFGSSPNLTFASASDTLNVGRDALSDGQINVYGGSGGGTSEVRLYNSSASQTNTVFWSTGTANGDFILTDSSFNRYIEIDDFDTTMRFPQQTVAKIDADDGFTAATKQYVLDKTLSPVSTVAGLPGTPSQGDRAFVTDSTVVAAGNFGNVVAGSGANFCPVYYDGTDWRIG